MSNVLIGIIGVILFIGLALAGALILGDDFRSSKNDSKAAETMQALSQIAAAVTMSNLKTGSLMRANPGGIGPTHPLIPRFLKTPPVHPLDTGRLFGLVEATGGANNDFATTVSVVLGTDVTARSVCESIQRQTGQIAGNATFDGTIRGLAMSALPGNAGCFFNSVNYTAFIKI